MTFQTNTTIICDIAVVQHFKKQELILSDLHFRHNIAKKKTKKKTLSSILFLNDSDFEWTVEKMIQWLKDDPLSPSK